MKTASGKTVTGGDVGGLLIAAAVLAVVSAYTWKTLWWWFVVPLGMPPLAFWQAAGIGTIVSSFRRVNGEWPDKTWGEILGAGIGAYGACLGFGYLEHLLMVR